MASKKKKDESEPTPINDVEQKDPELLPEDQRMPDPEPVPEPEPPQIPEQPELEPHEDPAHEEYVEVTAFAAHGGRPLTIEELGKLEPSPEMARIIESDEEE